MKEFTGFGIVKNTILLSNMPVVNTFPNVCLTIFKVMV